MSKTNKPPLLPGAEELEKKILHFAYRGGREAITVFTDFLSYLIWCFSPLGPKLSEWRYNKEETQFFVELTQLWLSIMNAEIESSKWFDPFGDLYMTLASKSGKQTKGQFFTPTSVVDFMAKVVVNPDTTGITQSDPCCGSGRFSLAFNANCPGNKVYAEDIDMNCCKMTVCNFLVHGCNGWVICHNSLSPDSFTRGWRVNEFYSEIGLPHVREISEYEYKSRIGLNYTSIALAEKLSRMLENACQKDQLRQRVSDFLAILRRLDNQNNS